MALYVVEQRYRAVVGVSDGTGFMEADAEAVRRASQCTRLAGPRVLSLIEPLMNGSIDYSYHCQLPLACGEPRPVPAYCRLQRLSLCDPNLQVIVGAFGVSGLKYRD